jgi:hypothetical protein
MEDNKFVRDLKEGATGRRLPTIEDLGPSYISPFEESANPNLKLPLDEEIEDLDEDMGDKQEKPNEDKKDILTKVIELHKEGKTIDEIYSILKEQGYSYQSIENAILELIKEEKTKPKIEEKIEDTEKEPKKLVGLPKKINLEETPTTEPKSTEEFEDIQEGDFAPLFIKVGKYRETLEALQNLENYLNGMAKLFNLVNKLEKIREDNLTTLNEMYQKASETTSRLFSGLLKPKGMKLEGGRENRAEMEGLNEVVSNLNKELENLRGEVDKIKGFE